MNHSLSLFLLSLWLFTLCCHVSTYSQISAYGGTNDAGPKIFKSLNADLVFPETFNSSSKIVSTTVTPSIQMPATNYPQYGSVNDAPMPAAVPVIFVTPPTAAATATAEQTPLTPQMHDKQALESNQMSATMKTDYQMQTMQTMQQDATYESQHTASRGNNNNLQQQQLQQQQDPPFTSTGRAIDYRPAPTHQQLEQFANSAGKLNTAPVRPYVVRPSPGSYAMRPQKAQFMQYGRGKVVPYPTYPTYRLQQRPPTQALRRPLSQSNFYKTAGGGRAQISDRFTPGEAVASALFAQKGHKHHHQHAQQGQGGKVAASSNYVQSFVPAKDLYAFPPNINAKYPKPADDPKISLPSSSINSYAPAPAGPISSNVGYTFQAAASGDSGYKYPGPVNQAYLPPNGDGDGKTKEAESAKPMDNGGGADGGGDMEDNDDTVGVLPASAMDAGDDNKPDAAADDMKPMDDMGAMPMMGDGDHFHDHDHDHHLTGYDTGKEYPTPPPGWMEEHPVANHFSHYPHHFPEIIYDDHHHHDFHHDHHHDEPPPEPHTTVPPPPEPLPSEQPQEPRVKKYSYFYIGRKLWYIPLYFTVWFSFYVLWLILKSIARHKVNLPNHYVSRRSLSDYSDEKAKDNINKLTIYVLQQIEGFQNKYSTQ